MYSGCHTVFVCNIRYLFKLKCTAACKYIGMNDRNSARLDECFKAFLKIDVLSGANGYGRAVSETNILICIHPRNHVLDPSKVVRLHSARKSDTVLNANMTEMVDCQRNLVADDLTYLFYIIFKEIKPLFGEMYTRVRMSCCDYRIALLMLYHISGNTSALNVKYV